MVQVYLGRPEAGVPRPARELKAFARLHLQPGERREVTLPLSPRAFAWFDEGARLWRVEAGRFTVEAGFSATDLPLSAEVERPAAEIAP